MSDSPKDAAVAWVHTRQARDVFRRIQPGDFTRHERAGVTNSVAILVPQNGTARRAQLRLETLRREAIDRELGFTWGETQHPFDKVRATMWLDADCATTTVFEAIMAMVVASHVVPEAA